MRFACVLLSFIVFAGLVIGQAPTEPPAKKKLSKAEVEKALDEFMTKFDKNKDGFLTKDEIPQFPMAIERLDKNGDGKLDRFEILPLALGGRGPMPGGPTVDTLLKQLDADGDGKISRKEAKGRLLDNFDQADRNKDGFLDRQELGQLLAGMPAGQKKGPPGAGFFGRPQGPDFDALDRNADGRLSRDELKGTRWADQFDAIDADKSGQIDRREFEGYLRLIE